MIEVKGLDHIVLRTGNIQAMLHFYRDILHCPIERELPELGLTQLRAGNALIDLVVVDSELGKLGGKAPSQNGRNVDHFCLQIAPLEENALLNYLDQSGLIYEPFAERYGAQGFGRSIYIHDPEGNVVELKAQTLT
ncbi:MULTISPECIES: VOC family protein [Vibrio]|uniref:VOC family protein n=1 Tax=Vibrio neptunius TaxID=170651 RepID=A0ABS3A6F4_9VIBR|nr:MULTISPECIES: VOC family protein [Vibrio]KJY86104.1 lactoylglutathione lyase [Vibrio neptunius]MBN3494949.1 VOC family protein [Vibrio neptunius]MBN3517369.1 VOC family protein [Vibrio neptunius]MBN3551807.1 VOC family protein [Vibrio neptunius]MBN3579799.1 VOC family protein [Vibrio neptunius]